MTTTESESLNRPEEDVDALLRDTLRDDLPPQVEARLERGVEQFVAARVEAERRSGAGLLRLVWAPSPRVMAIAAGLLLACGLGLQARSAPDGTAASLSDLSATVSLARVVRTAVSMRCTGFEDAALASPAALADHIYRRWVLLGMRTRPDGAVIREFQDSGQPAVYQLVSDGLQRPPREIRRSPPGTVSDATTGRGDVATCTWDVPPPGTQGIVLMLGR